MDRRSLMPCNQFACPDCVSGGAHELFWNVTPSFKARDRGAVLEMPIALGQIAVVGSLIANSTLIRMWIMYHFYYNLCSNSFRSRVECIVK